MTLTILRVLATKNQESVSRLTYMCISIYIYIYIFLLMNNLYVYIIGKTKALHIKWHVVVDYAKWMIGHSFWEPFEAILL